MVSLAAGSDLGDCVVHVGSHTVECVRVLTESIFRILRNTVDLDCGQCRTSRRRHRDSVNGSLSTDNQLNRSVNVVVYSCSRIVDGIADQAVEAVCCPEGCCGQVCRIQAMQGSNIQTSCHLLGESISERLENRESALFRRIQELIADSVLIYHLDRSDCLRTDFRIASGLVCALAHDGNFAAHCEGEYSFASKRNRLCCTQLGKCGMSLYRIEHVRYKLRREISGCCSFGSHNCYFLS